MDTDPKSIAIQAATAADAKKASDIVVIDVTELSDVTDYLVICTVDNRPQADAVFDEVEEELRLVQSVKPLSVEGRESYGWVLLDYGPVVVHIFQRPQRDYYRLDSYWGDAPRVELALDGAAELPDAPASVEERQV